ncbi:ABC transporter ATP-binding protein [Candidatus Lokiarchaeum ossiferum]|uniref:ABC transporter ATP-binding protein n=1 Tax=Candidatus Lokiarchaeum ossiferum TaxID=2951803 RepID=UPI00352D454B
MIKNETEASKMDEGFINASDDKSLPLKQRQVNISCQNVFRIFQQGNLEVVALKGVNMNIYAGEIVVIMGPSGSGKTTLLNVISGMDQASAGHVFIRGFDVTRMKDEGVQQILQNEIGIVFQFFNLIPSLTAEGNVELPMTIAKKSNEYKRTRVHELIKEIGLEDRAHHRPFTLSGGEKQRVAIAMAFANNPTIILADEPTGNIDSISSEKIMNIFRQFIQKNPDKSIVIVTHNPEVRKIADRTLIIKDGQIIRELGKIDSENTDSIHEDDEGMQEMDKIVQMQKEKDKVEKILNPDFRFIDFQDINVCPRCKSENILKNFDQEDGSYKVKNNQLVTRAVIFCPECYQVYYQWVSLFDIRQEVS